MQLIKTIKVKIHKPTKVKARLMHLIHENALLLNQYAGLIQKHKTASKAELHRLTYKTLRETSKLPSAIIQTARDKAIEAHKSYRGRVKRKMKASPPAFGKNAPVRLDSRTLQIRETGNKIKYFASLATNGERVHVPLLGHRYQHKYLAMLVRGELQMGAAELLRKGDDFYIYLTVKKEAAPCAANESATPIAVDLGLVNLSTSVILRGGKPTNITFHRGGNAIRMRNHFAAFRASLGKAKKLWRIKSAKRKEQRWMRDLNHKISSAIVRQASSVANPVIVLERLKYIRRKINYSRKMNMLLHGWSFAQLQSFIAYKAAWAGIPVAYVKADYTSQCCSKCGHTEKANRKGRIFRCRKCGYALNADLNAAINIGGRYKTFASGYMPDVMGDVAAPLALEAIAYQGSLRL
ncbi:MAG: transposase [Candidatus Diapherotrites archaeon]